MPQRKSDYLFIRKFWLIALIVCGVFFASSPHYTIAADPALSSQNIKPSPPTVYLTFDDGPTPLTSEVLDILHRERVKATFFVQGERAGQEPGLIRRALREGHAIGNHCYDHAYTRLYSSFQTFWNEVQRTEQIVYGISGIRPQLVRAPGGTYSHFDQHYYRYMKEAGYIVYDWHIDSGDSKGNHVPAGQIVQTVATQPLKHELVVLLHDGPGHKETVKALPEIISFYKKKGYAFAPLTPKVAPVQFPVGKLKWTQQWPADLDALYLNRARVHAALAAAVPGSQDVNSHLPLEVIVASARVVFHQYQYSDGDVRVPLRPLAEAAGGTVIWDEQRHKAIVRKDFVTIEYDLANHRIRTASPAGVKQVPLGDMGFRDGEIYVPLMGTLEKLAGQPA